MADQPFRPMQIGQILDKSTVVIIGPGVEGLMDGDELQILAVGREIPTLGVPLVVPKAVVRVQSAAGAYVVAGTETYQVEVGPAHLDAYVSVLTKKRIETRQRLLQVDEAQIVGNPSNSPVAVGDPVIRPLDLPRFIASLGPKPGSLGDMIKRAT